MSRTRQPRQQTKKPTPEVTQYFKNQYEHKRSYAGAFFGVMLILLGITIAKIDDSFLPATSICVIYGVGILCVSLQKWEHQLRGVVETKEIYSLKNQSGVNGSFLLGVGSVDSSEEYIYFRKGDHGGLIRDTHSTEDVEVIMTDAVPPSIKTVIVPDGNPKNDDTMWEEKTFLFCPKNTIQKRYKIN